MKKIVISLLSILGFFSIVSTYAISISSAPSMKATSNTSITIEWNAIEDALGYYVYYDTASGESSGYRNEVPDLIEDTQYIIEWLSPSTQYYIAISAVDIEAEESGYSPELVVSTSGPENTNVFALENVEATQQDELTLTFSAPLEDVADAQREFLILHNQTEEEVFAIDTQLNQQDPRILTVMLDRDLELGARYDFTILAIADVSGRNIESGIDALTNFQVPQNFSQPTVSTPESEVELNAAWPTPDPEPQTNPEPQTSPEPETSSTAWGNAGTIISGGNQKDVAATATSTEKLPQTGPEHILLFVLALLLWSGIFFVLARRQKS